MSVICLSSDDEDDCVILDSEEEEELEQHKVFIVEKGTVENCNKEDQDESSPKRLKDGKKDEALQVLATKLAEVLENNTRDIARNKEHSGTCVSNIENTVYEVSKGNFHPSKTKDLKEKYTSKRNWKTTAGKLKKRKHQNGNLKSDSKTELHQDSRHYSQSSQSSDQNPQSNQFALETPYENKLKIIYDKTEATYSVSVVSPTKDNSECEPSLSIIPGKMSTRISSDEPNGEEKLCQVYSASAVSSSKDNHAEYESTEKTTSRQKPTGKPSSAFISDKTSTDISLEEPSIKEKRKDKLETLQMPFCEIENLKTTFKKHHYSVFGGITDSLCVNMGHLLLETMEETKKLQKLMQTAQKNLSIEVNSQQSCGSSSVDLDFNTAIQVCKGRLDKLKFRFIEDFSKIHNCINLSVIDTQLKIVFLTAWFMKMFLSMKMFYGIGSTADSQELTEFLHQVRTKTLHILSGEIVRWPLVSKAFIKEESVFETDCLLVLNFIRNCLEGQNDEETSAEEIYKETIIENSPSSNDGKNQNLTVASNESELNKTSWERLSKKEPIDVSVSTSNLPGISSRKTTHSSIKKTDQAITHQTKFGFSSSLGSLSQSPSREPLQTLQVVNIGLKRKHYEGKSHRSKRVKRNSFTENEQFTLSSTNSKIRSNTKTECLPNTVKTNMHSKNKAVEDELKNKPAPIAIHNETGLELSQPSPIVEPPRIMCRLQLPDKMLQFLKQNQVSKNKTLCNQDDKAHLSSNQNFHSRPLKDLHYKNQYHNGEKSHIQEFSSSFPNSKMPSNSQYPYGLQDDLQNANASEIKLKIQQLPLSVNNIGAVERSVSHPFNIQTSVYSYCGIKNRPAITTNSYNVTNCANKRRIMNEMDDQLCPTSTHCKQKST